MTFRSDLQSQNQLDAVQVIRCRRNGLRRALGLFDSLWHEGSFVGAKAAHESAFPLAILSAGPLRWVEESADRTIFGTL
jgi:hypothetical protein